MNSSVLVEAKKIFASIQFPSQPQILINIRQEINKPEPEFKTIAQLVNQDLALTAKVIKVVNSSFFGLRSEVKSIGHALAMLGLENFNNLILASSMRDALGTKHMSAKEVDIFFEHSLLVAKVTQVISKKNLHDVDRASLSGSGYMAGLFHDCGIPVLANKFPDYFQKITEGLEANLLVEKIEEEAFGTTHSVVGAMIAKAWKLPALVGQVIYYHHQEDFSFHEDKRLRIMLANVMLAENIVAEHKYMGFDDSTGIDLYNSKVSGEESLTNLLHEVDLTIEEFKEIEDFVEDTVLN